MNTRITVFGVVLIGLWLIGVALALVPVPPGSVHAPRWLLGVIGAVFMLGGLLAATTSGGRLATALAASLLSLLGGLGAWVAAFGAADMLRVTAVSGAAGAGMAAPLTARIGFGVGAFIVLIWAAYAWRQVFRLR